MQFEINKIYRDSYLTGGDNEVTITERGEKWVRAVGEYGARHKADIFTNKYGEYAYIDGKYYCAVYEVQKG